MAATQQAPAREPDREMRAYMAITRRLPKVFGVGAFANVLKRLYARKPRAPVVCEVHGARMLLDPNDELDRELIFTPQLYDREMLDFLRAALKPGDAFLDAGAHVGGFTVVAAPLVAPGRVLAVDADPHVFSILRRNVEMNKLSNVALANVGLSDKRERLRFHRGDEGLRGVSNFIDGTGESELDLKPLAEVAAEHGFESFAGVKIDIEGFEFRVLRRYLEDVPRECWPRFFIVERLPHLVERAGGDVVELLRSKGYEVRWSRAADHVMALP